MNAPAKGIGLATIVALIRKEISDAGEIGPQGEQGPKGERGPQGPKGNTGPTGKQGPKGKDGKQGKAGKDGQDGKDGEDGVGIEDIHQDGDDMMVITMTDGEVYEIELPKGENTEVRYNQSGGGGGGSVDLSKYVEKPTTDEGWMVYKLGEGWALATTDLIETNPDVTFRDAKGRYKSTEDVSDLTNQLKVNRFIANELDAQAESLAKEAEMRRTKDEFLQEQIDNINESGYDDTAIWEALSELPVTVATDPPEIHKDGELWYDDERLELFVSYQGGWISTTPLTARVEAGEAIQKELIKAVDEGVREQTQLRSRIGDLEYNSATKSDLNNYLPLKGGTGNKMQGNLYMASNFIAGVGEPTAKDHAATKEYADRKLATTGGTMTGQLKMKRTDDVSYWNYISSETPTAWHKEEKTHGLILKVGTTNSYKQQFKIVGRSNKDLFKVYDDGTGNFSFYGNVGVTGYLKQDGKPVATEHHVAEEIAKIELPQSAPAQPVWKKISTSGFDAGCLSVTSYQTSTEVWVHAKSANGFEFAHPAGALHNSLNRTNIRWPISVFRDKDGKREWCVSGTAWSVEFLELGNSMYYKIKIKNEDDLILRNRTAFDGLEVGIIFPPII